MIKEFKTGFLIAVSFLFTLGLVGITYAAFVNITEVSTSEILTADLMNNVINNQKDLDSKIDGAAIPVGAVMAFFGDSCPSGWNEANGSGDEKNTLGVADTLDLRGTFVRGMNGDGNSRDVSRDLGNYQADSFMSHLHSVNPPSTTTSTDGNHTHKDWIRSNSGGSTNRYAPTTGKMTVQRSTGAAGTHNHTLDIPVFDSENTGGTETTPKNVALLYCVKD